LRGKPLFKDKADEFLEFVGDSVLIAHNAQFDMGFINAELTRSDREPLPAGRFKDTLAMAHLSGGRAMSLGLDAKPEIAESESGFPAAKRRPAPLVLNPSEDEIKAHREFIGSFKQTAVWEKVWARRERNRL